MKWLAAPLCLTLFLHPAFAGGSLDGRIVTLNVETWNDTLTPFFTSRGRTVKVGGLVEFAMLPEGGMVGFDVVMVDVDISATRIEFSYGDAAGRFWPAPFNGYVLRFEGDCALFDSISIDAAFTTMPVTPAHIRSQGGALYIDVAGMEYGPNAQLGLDIRVSDCLLG